MIERMVAGEGVEPPPPAFSDLVQSGSIYTYSTYRFAGDCQLPANTCKAEQSWAGIMGWFQCRIVGGDGPKQYQENGNLLLERGHRAVELFQMLVGHVNDWLVHE